LACYTTLRESHGYIYGLLWFVILNILSPLAVFGTIQAATIFETRPGRYRDSRPFRTIPAPNPEGHHRHINSFALPDPNEIERLRLDMHERLRKYNEEDSNGKLKHILQAVK